MYLMFVFSKFLLADKYCLGVEKKKLFQNCTVPLKLIIDKLGREKYP